MNNIENSEKKSNAPETILVVDDEAIVLEVASSMLEGMGFRVLKATDGHECVEIFNQNKDEIALVLLDATMPLMNGEEAFRELCRIQPDVKVILSSGYSDEDSIQYFISQGFAGFIQKPYSLNQLIEKVNEVQKINPPGHTD